MSEKRDIFIDLYLEDENNLSMKDINRVVQDALKEHFEGAVSDIYRIDMHELSTKYPEHHEVKRNRK